jgi:hypothetical protein
MAHFSEFGNIQQLYRVETEAKGLDAVMRRTRRQEQAGPVLERFKPWREDQVGVVLPKSPIGEAVTYARGQWTALTRYLEDGALAIDNNNAAERGPASGHEPEELALLRER